MRTLNYDEERQKRAMAREPEVLRRLGFTRMREGQAKVARTLMAGCDLLGIMPTSAGKTASFIIPALCLDERMLVFSPLVALIRDQVNGLQNKGIVALAMSSQQTQQENLASLQAWVSGECKILYVAPERLRNPEFVNAMRMAPPQMVTVDEVHTLSNWSDNFRHSYVLIGEIIDNYNPRTVAGFTATFSPEIELDVRRVLRIPAGLKITHYPRRENLVLSSSTTSPDEVDVQAAALIKRQKGTCLEYAGTQDQVEKSAAFLSEYLQEEVGFYHGGVSSSARKDWQDRFMDGDIRVMVATNAFGMGVDKANIRMVIHRDYPSDLEALAQETGRAGRDDERAWCHTFAHRDAYKLQKYFLSLAHPSEKQLRDVYAIYLGMCGPDGTFQADDMQVSKNCGFNVRLMKSISQVLFGSRVVDHSTDSVMLHRVQILQEGENGKHYAKFCELLHSLADPELENNRTTWSFDLDIIASRMELSPQTVRSYLNAWKAEGSVVYLPPPRGKPKKIIGDIRQVDFGRLAEKRENAYNKLEEHLLPYFDVPDDEKHTYLEAYFKSHLGV